MEIGDIVSIKINLGNCTRIARCIIMNKYKKNNKFLYSIKELNGIYRCSNVTEDRFL